MPTLTGDGVVITNDYPAVEFIALETGNEYHEDREVTWLNFQPADVSYMYRVVNATFDGTHWNLKNTALRAYAYAQLPDGSMGFYASPAEAGVPITQWLPNAWNGSGNFTRFNAADYGMDPLQTATENSAALEAVLNDAAGAGGGRVFIPAGIYQCNQVSIPDSNTAGPIGLVIEGAGGSTVLHSSGGQHMFYAAGDNGNQGVRIRDLAFTYQNDYSPLGAWCAIYSTVQDVICENCYFQNWPTTFHMEGNHNGMLNCAIIYNGLSATDTVSPTMIDIEKSDDFVANCYIYVVNGGPTGVVGILVGSASEPRVTDTNIVNCDYGIMVTGGPNLIHGFFTGVAAECGVTALTIGPPASNSHLCSELFFNGCVFERTHHSTNTEPGVVIAAFSGDYNENVSDIFFTNCMSHDWGGSGMAITGGQDIIVTGGRFGSNGTGESVVHDAGISVTGPVMRLSIIGSDLSGTIPPYPAQPSSGAQPYGIAVTGDVVGMVVRDCNLQGNATTPLYVPTNGTDLAVTNCLGYNDQNTAITGGAPGSGGDHAANRGYYGPSVVLFHASAGLTISVTIYGTALSMMFGTVPMPLATDTIAFGTAPSIFAWIGK